MFEGYGELDVMTMFMYTVWTQVALGFIYYPLQGIPEFGGINVTDIPSYAFLSSSFSLRYLCYGGRVFPSTHIIIPLLLSLSPLCFACDRQLTRPPQNHCGWHTLHRGAQFLHTCRRCTPSPGLRLGQPAPVLVLLRR